MERFIRSNKESTPVEVTGPLKDIYQRAFRESPVWQEELTGEVVNQRLETQFSKAGFGLIVARTEVVIKGGLWYDTPTLAEMESERGRDLANLARVLVGDAKIKIVWEREIVVDPAFQGQGVATNLRERFIKTLEEDFSSGALVLTRMRNNNLAIIRVAEKLGYVDTGIETESNWRPPMKNSYWFRKVNF